METQENRQSLKSFNVLLILTCLLFSNINYAQENKKVNYSQASNILDPDTLIGDNKKVFWHFVKLSHAETKALTPTQILNEFKKLGIFRKERARFVAAYGFTRITMTGHKKSCENFAYFDFLKPKD